MDKYGLIGYPLGHSFSISYFNEKFENENIDAQYINFEIPTIDALPEKTRAAILGVIVDGKRYKEVADSLNVSVNTVKTLLAHGLKQLRAQFPDPAILFLALCKGL